MVTQTTTTTAATVIVQPDSPPAATGKRAKAVTLYEGNWHELEHDRATRQPYLGVE